MRKALLLLSVLLLSFPLAGCWDRREVSELALVTAKGIDITDNKRVRVSVQVAIPGKVGGGQTGSSKGGGGKSYFVVSATGRSVAEADAHLQQSLSRQLYLPHLRIIIIGDRLARSGMEDVLDHFGRNPPHRLRSTIIVAKNNEALTLLNMDYPLESISAEAVRKLERQLTGTNSTLMDFLIQAASDGMDQFASAISLKSQDTGKESKPYFTFSSTAVFRDLKLVGYLNRPETVALQWISQRLRFATLTMVEPQTGKTITVELSQARRRARTFVKGNHVSVHYELSGTALLTENETGLDAADPRTVTMFQTAVNMYVEKIAKECLNKLSKQYDADAVGVGRMVYHQHPYDWERLKPSWHELFANVNYSMEAKVKILATGKSGPPLYQKTYRGIKRDPESTVQVGGGSQ